uniref:Ras-associating domain-containing protein n=1 Tax=Steinernema glaseri TaxID=37863 RepID=A0A1I8AT96_9BILA
MSLAKQKSDEADRLIAQESEAWRRGLPDACGQILAMGLELTQEDVLEFTEIKRIYEEERVKEGPVFISSKFNDLRKAQLNDLILLVDRVLLKAQQQNYMQNIKHHTSSEPPQNSSSQVPLAIVHTPRDVSTDLPDDWYDGWALQSPGPFVSSLS